MIWVSGVCCCRFLVAGVSVSSAWLVCFRRVVCNCMPVIVVCTCCAVDRTILIGDWFVLGLRVFLELRLDSVAGSKWRVPVVCWKNEFIAWNLFCDRSLVRATAAATRSFRMSMRYSSCLVGKFFIVCLGMSNM